MSSQQTARSLTRRQRAASARHAPAWPQDGGVRLEAIDGQTWAVVVPDPRSDTRMVLNGTFGFVLERMAHSDTNVGAVEGSPGAIERLRNATATALAAYDSARTALLRGATVLPGADESQVEALPVRLAEARITASAWVQSLRDARVSVPDVARDLITLLDDERLDLQVALARWRLARAIWG